MDVKVSRKEERMQPEGPVEVLVDNIFDLFPIFGNDPRASGLDLFGEQDPENLIVDIEILDDPRAELLDRAMFATVKQRGMDPLEPEDGIQWAEYMLGEVPDPAILQQVNASVSKEGPGVRVVLGTVYRGNEPYTLFKLELTNAA